MMRVRHRTSRVICIVLLFVATVARGQNSIDVQQLNKQKARWPEMADEKQRISLGGRFSGRAGNLFRMQKCELSFRAQRGLNLPRIRSGNNVEVIGFLRQHEGQIEFLVERIAQGKADADVLQSRKNRLSPSDFKAWYELAEWARRRAEFYEDSVLLDGSQELLQQGFKIERQSIARGEHKKLRALAERAKELQLDEALRNDLIHQSLRWQWAQLAAKKPLPVKERTAFLKQLGDDLKNARQPIRLQKPKLQREYKIRPEQTYADAKLSDRILLHRYFYREVLLPMIVAELKSDGSNGEAVSLRLRREIPEESELADDYEARELQFRVKNSNSLTRSEMLDLVDQLERTNQRKLAKETKTKWVRASASRLATRGPAGLVQAANEYDALLGDRTKAIQLLKQAWQESPEKAEIEQRLERFGVYRRENAWMSKAQVDALPENQIDQAMRDARVIPGMNMDQVRKSLGQPDRVSRMITLGQTQIAWSFLDASSNRVVVLFRRKGSDGPLKTKVISVSTLPAK